MKLSTVDVEQANEDLRREVTQLRRVVFCQRGSEERRRMIIDAEPECVKMLGPDGDITEQKEAEEKLRASEQRLMSIYNTVADVIFHLAVEGEDAVVHIPAGACL
jgi:PAS domain-containing protein